MAQFLVMAAMLVALGVPGGTSPILEEAASMTPLEAARMAIEDYNAEPGGHSIFRLLKLRHTHKTRFDWGVHFSMNFTIKETHCRKTSSYRMGSCRYKANGAISDCSAEVSVLNFIHNSPLTSMKCQSLPQHARQQVHATGKVYAQISTYSKPAKPSSKKAKSKSQAVQAPSPVRVGYYFPSSYSTAALAAIVEE